MNKSVRLLFLTVMLVPVLLFSQIDYKGFPEWSLQKKDSTEYALYTPAQIQPGKKYPIALFMHGCCGVDNHASLRNAVDPPARMWHRFGENRQDIPTYIIAPATSRGWQQHFKSLKAVIDDLVANQQGDPQRIYVCGFSMGGEGTFRIIQEYPGYFAAAITMGMSFRGDSSKVKDIPIWANQGETDFYARNLRNQVAAIRSLNGLSRDTGNTWITGVNPRYSNFRGVGHGVQWDAASTQDLTGWAYSKINDGNKYPVVFFNNVDYPVPAEAGKPVELTITATDPDGSIRKVDILVNHVLVNSLTNSPYRHTIKPARGDNIIEAIAIDQEGKKSTATTIIQVKIPLQLVTKRLPVAYAGDYYETKLLTNGNGRLMFSVNDKKNLPDGIQLYADGSIKGIATQKGVYKAGIDASDENGKRTAGKFEIRVRKKKPTDVLISNIKTKDGVQYKLSKLKIGEAPFFNSKDSILAFVIDEINFSNAAGYAGVTYIQTDVNDADKAGDGFLHFNTDEDVIVYIAYEKLDKTLTSTIPGWLKDFKKEDGQIVAQYRYFDIFSKPFKKGPVALPGADAKRNGVASNYFVMVKKHKG